MQIPAILLLLLAGMTPAAAQSLFGTILGRVTDASQAAVPNAKVAIRNIGTNAVRALITDSYGDYQAPT